MIYLFQPKAYIHEQRQQKTKTWCKEITILKLLNPKAPITTKKTISFSKKLLPYLSLLHRKIA